MAPLTTHSPSIAGPDEERLTPLADNNMDDAIGDGDAHSSPQEQNTSIPSSSIAVPSSGNPDPAPTTPRHICPSCNAAHTTAKTLRRHLICHESAKLTCAICTKVLKRKTDLSRHMRIHETATFSVCDGVENEECACGHVFTRRDTMIRHWRAVEKRKRERESTGTVSDGVL
ncbi:DNA-binding transcription factor adr1 [Maublancomyces gigas]|uniref:DNA-binding transcription factor adr1 n=1 Tax=Discina gigas TaxID=1032678 RepID=A0ABR3G831_9PEZI